MILMANFKESLKSGKELEYYINSKIKQKYPKSYVIEGYCKEYDIFIPEKNYGIEVKRDEKSKYTGNYLIEIEFDDKPSGLSTTKAEYWVIYDGEYEIWIKPRKLKDIVSAYGKVSRFIGNGDTKYKRAYLIPKDKIKVAANKIYKGKYESLH